MAPSYHSGARGGEEEQAGHGGGDEVAAGGLGLGEEGGAQGGVAGGGAELDEQAGAGVGLGVAGEAVAQGLQGVAGAAEAGELAGAQEVEEGEVGGLGEGGVEDRELLGGRERAVLDGVHGEEDVVAEGAAGEASGEPAVGAAVEPPGGEALDVGVGDRGLGVAAEVEEGEGGLVARLGVVGVGRGGAFELGEGLGVLAGGAEGRAALGVHDGGAQGDAVAFEDELHATGGGGQLVELEAAAVDDGDDAAGGLAVGEAGGVGVVAAGVGGLALDVEGGGDAAGVGGGVGVVAEPAVDFEQVGEVGEHAVHLAEGLAAAEGVLHEGDGVGGAAAVEAAGAELTEGDGEELVGAVALEAADGGEGVGEEGAGLVVLEVVHEGAGLGEGVLPAHEEVLGGLADEALEQGDVAEALGEALGDGDEAAAVVLDGGRVGADGGREGLPAGEGGEDGIAVGAAEGLEVVAGGGGLEQADAQLVGGERRGGGALAEQTIEEAHRRTMVPVKAGGRHGRSWYERGVSRELDLHDHMHKIAAAGDDLAALFEAGTAGALALSFRATDAMIGLTPVDEELVREASEQVLAALQRCGEAGEARAWGMMAEAVVHEDPDRALAWWERGARAGDAAARLALVRGLWARRDTAALAEIRGLLVAAVEAGESCGAEERYLGWFAFNGIGGPRDAAASYRWQVAGAERGDADAMFELYVLRSTGQGCGLDEEDALQWCRRAAEAGSARAMSNLGGFHATGRGVPLDLELAVQWYRRAVDAGSGRAAANLGVMAATGEGMAADEAEARRWFMHSEALGYPWWEMVEAAGLDPEAYAPEA